MIGHRVAWCSHGPGRAVLGLLLWMAATACLAVEPFTEARFKALQAEGALVLVDVHASWCPTCAKQQEVLDAWEAARPGAVLHRLLVDFDTQKEWVTHFKAPRQSTLILFKGETRQWFAVAETRQEAIFAALDAAAGTAR